jgi:hypothetical protein
MSSGSYLTSKLNDKIIKMPSKFHETIPLSHHMVRDLLPLHMHTMPVLSIKKYFKKCSYIFWSTGILCRGTNTFSDSGVFMGIKNAEFYAD